MMIIQPAPARTRERLDAPRSRRPSAAEGLAGLLLSSLLLLSGWHNHINYDISNINDNNNNHVSDIATNGIAVAGGGVSQNRGGRNFSNGGGL